MVSMCLIHTFLLSVQCCYVYLACFVPLVWLSLLICIFTRLPTCSCMSLYVVHTPIQWNYEHSIQTYICLPRAPFLFDNMFVCPRLALSLSLIASLLACFLFACLLDCFFCHCMYTHRAWTLGARVQPPRHKQKGQGCKQEDGQCLID